MVIGWVAALRSRGVGRSQVALLAALAIDNVGSGMFLPLALVYATRVVDLSVGDAGGIVAVATVLGLGVPPLAGRLSHRFGPRAVVVLSQLVQGAGAVTYLVAASGVTVFVSAGLMAVGAQLFYCSVFVLIADVTRSEAKERPFALVAMIRSAAFGLGTLVSAVVLSWDSDTALRWLVGLDASTFLLAAVLLAAYVVTPEVDHDASSAAGPLTVLRDPAYRGLIVATCLVGLGTDVALVGMPVFVLDVLEGPSWLPGVLLAAATVLSSIYGVRVVDALRPYRRTQALQAGAWVFVAWSLLTVVMVWLPPSGWLVVYAFAVWVLWVAGSKIYFPIAGALSEALPPRTSRVGYMATYQYAFTMAQVLAPAVVGLFAVSDSLPWLVVAVCAGLAVVVLRWFARSLPEGADVRHLPPPSSRSSVASTEMSSEMQ